MGTYIVTGASSGIGRAITKALLEKNNRVYGLGRNFSDEYKTESFVKIALDLRQESAVKEICEIVKDDIDGLINAAGVAYYGTHESLTQSEISEMVDVNIKVPLLLTNAFLPKIRKTSGHIINISSVTAKHTNNTHGVAYGVTKAALTSFGMSLFEEIRKQNVRVTTIHPDITDTNLYRNADFRPGDGTDEALFADDIAACVIRILEARWGLNIEDITIRPQKFKIEKKSEKC